MFGSTMKCFRINPGLKLQVLVQVWKPLLQLILKSKSIVVYEQFQNFRIDDTDERVAMKKQLIQTYYQLLHKRAIRCVNYETKHAIITERRDLPETIGPFESTSGSLGAPNSTLE